MRVKADRSFSSPRYFVFRRQRRSLSSRSSLRCAGALRPLTVMPEPNYLIANANHAKCGSAVGGSMTPAEGRGVQGGRPEPASSGRWRQRVLQLPCATCQQEFPVLALHRGTFAHQNRPLGPLSLSSEGLLRMDIPPAAALQQKGRQLRPPRIFGPAMPRYVRSPDQPSLRLAQRGVA